MTEQVCFRVYIVCVRACDDVPGFVSSRPVEQVVPPDENLCLRVDFWGKMRVGQLPVHLS